MESSSSAGGRFSSQGKSAERSILRGNSERWVRAIAASPGIAIGAAVILSPQKGTPAAQEAEPLDEWQRYQMAVEALRAEWGQAREIAAAEAPAVVPIIDSYLRMLTEATLKERIWKAVAAGSTVERVLQQVFEPIIGRLRRSSSVSFQERGVELEQVFHRLLSLLQQQRLDYSRVAGAIVVATALTPSDVLLLHRAGAQGFVTAVGGITSHTTILARSLQMPAVIGLRGAIGAIAEGDPLVVDGYTGVVVIHPDGETCRRYERHRDSTEWRRRILVRFTKLPAETTDGRRFRLMVNLTSMQDVEEALLVGAEGIGLVRTELLPLQLGRLPTEEEQFHWYRQIAERFYPQPVTIRLFDLGGDKYSYEFVPERNPALGMRGIRFLLARREILRTQLRALLRAAVMPNVRLLVPMVSTEQEVFAVRHELEVVRQCLAGEGILYGERLPFGIMVETPAAALIMERLAPLADFLSIGSNDLTQYTLAVDRTHEMLAELYDPFHPAVWRLMVHVVEVARRHGIPVCVCGEITAHAQATELLVGLGVEELSTMPAAIVPLKHRIRRLSFREARRILLSTLNTGQEGLTI